MNKSSIAGQAKPEAPSVPSAMVEVSTHSTPRKGPGAEGGEYRRVRVVPPPVESAARMGAVCMESAVWRGKRGVLLGSRMMISHDRTEKRLIEQYGVECSVLTMDLNGRKTKFDIGTVIELGTPVWKSFEVHQGTLETVVANLKAEGWEVVPPRQQQAQLTLVDSL